MRTFPEIKIISIIWILSLRMITEKFELLLFWGSKQKYVGTWQFWYMPSWTHRNFPCYFIVFSIYHTLNSALSHKWYFPTIKYCYIWKCCLKFDDLNFKFLNFKSLVHHTTGIRLEKLIKRPGASRPEGNENQSLCRILSEESSNKT